MATWGIGIYQNDVGLDIKDRFIDTCRRGKTVEEATEYYIQEYECEIEDEDDAPDFWLALADVQWKCGHLQPIVKENALNYIELELSKGGKEFFDKKDVKKRIKVLEDLREKLNSPMQKPKNLKPYKLYKCEWKMGDIYAYPLDGEIFKDTEYYGRYVLFHKVMESTWHPGHIVPVVRVKITKDKVIPQIEDIDELSYIPMGRKADKYDYFLELISTSKRIIPKKLVYVGNASEITPPSDEYTMGIYPNFWAVSWKMADERIMRKLKFAKEEGRNL